MKWHLMICAFLGLSNASCEKHNSLEQELQALDALLLKETSVIDQLDKNILSSGGSEGAGLLLLRLDQLRASTTTLEEQNAALSKAWDDIDKEFSMLKPAAEAYKSAQPQ